MPPLYGPLVERMPPGALDELRGWISAAAERHGALFVDLDADPSWDFGRDRFRDALHYNPAGAAEYSRRVAREVLAPLLAEG